MSPHVYWAEISDFLVLFLAKPLLLWYMLVKASLLHSLRKIERRDLGALGVQFAAESLGLLH